MPDQQARQFLLEFKEAVGAGHGIDLIPRKPTLLTLQFLGLTKRNLEEIVLSLSVLDYCSGPEPDRDRGGEVWVFGADVGDHEVYIKLKLAESSGAKIPKCLSFHISKQPLKYPYRPTQDN